MNSTPFAYLLVFTASALTFVVTPVAAAERQIKPQGVYITQAMIESSKGNHLLIPRLGKFVIKNVSAPDYPNAKCNIDANSLKDLLQTRFRKGARTLAKGIVVTVELKMRFLDGEVYCLGGGTGCKVDIVVDDIYENAPL